jgi:hypothetical protein
MYYNARYYDPELGRFIQPDTMLDGLNRYTYCGGNPIVYSDPSGHLVGEILVAIVVVACMYIKGAEHAGSHTGMPYNWDITKWTWGDIWYGVTLGTGTLNTGWSSTTGPFINVGGDIHVSPGETTRQSDTEQKIAQTQDNLMVSLVEYNEFWNTIKNAGGPSPAPSPDPNIPGALPTPTKEPDPILFIDDGLWHCGDMGYNMAVLRGTYLGWKPGVQLLDSPMEDTAGFMYFYTAGGKIEHLQYFENFGGPYYYTWRTTGRGGDFPLNARNELPHPVRVNIDNSNLEMWGYDHVKYYTIGPAPRIDYLFFSIPFPVYLTPYSIDHRWKVK